jgi:L-ribulose-5-phosphate 3-epimerase
MKPLAIGVCSWSLGIKDLGKTLSVIREELDVDCVQIGFFGENIPAPADHDAIVQAARDSGLTFSAACIGFVGEDYSTLERIAATGGYVPDDAFDERFRQTVDTADLTAKLGLTMLAAHVGFVPHDRGDPKYATMVERLQQVTDALAERNLTLLMETGQEQAETLVAFIDDVGRENIRINFDPANMILYGVSDPVDAVGALGRRIAHVHMKDANWSRDPGNTWGQEVPLGAGEADIPRVVSKLRAIGYAGPLVIEREAGHNRLGDIRDAADLLRSLLG